MGLLDRLRGAAAGAAPAEPAVAATWMQVVSFRPAGYMVDVVGEANYQPALEWAAQGRTVDGPRRPLVTAQLVREPRNRYDRNAVRVDVGGHCVGYIPRGQASLFHSVLAQVRAAGMPATCRAWLTGGWDRGVLDRGHFGLQLDLHPDIQVVENGCVLPFGRGRVSVVEDCSDDELLELLEDDERIEVVARLEAGDRLRVFIGDLAVGGLTPMMSRRYERWVEQVSNAGLPASCEARVIREQRGPAVYLKLAKPWPESG